MENAVELTRGYWVIVDPEDHNWVSQFNWYVVTPCPRHPKSYGMMDVNTGYKQKRRYYLHRLLMCPPKGMVVDHINGNTLDNRKCNLRVVTQRENSQNSILKRKRVSKYRGVHWHKAAQKWCVQIGSRKDRVYIGLFTDEEKAGKAYDKMARRMYGKHARVNFGENSGV